MAVSLATGCARRAAFVLSAVQNASRVSTAGARTSVGSQHFSTAAASASAAAVPAALVKQLRELTGAPMVDCKAALQNNGNDVSKAVEFLKQKGMATASKKADRTAAQGLVTVVLAPSGTEGAIVELNSETDFVARNDEFKGLASRVATLALSTVPAGSATVSGGYNGQVAEAGAASLSSSSLPGGDSLGKPCSAGEAVKDLVGKIRENMVLRRAARLSCPDGLVVGYTHNAVAPGQGSIGVLVALAPAKAGDKLPKDNAALNDLARKVAMHVAAAKPRYNTTADIPEVEKEAQRKTFMEQGASSGKSDAIVKKMVEGKLAKYFSDLVLSEQAFVLSEDGAKVAKMVDQASKAAGAHAKVQAFVHFALGQGVAPAPAS